MSQPAWLERFKGSDPGNALPHYLAAREAFEQDRPQDALQELSLAATKGTFDPTTLEATWVTYLERMKYQGEWAALQWLNTQLEQP